MLKVTNELLDVQVKEAYKLHGVTDVQNDQTFREFIRESEAYFGMAPRDLESLTDEELNSYSDFLDELWNK
ncbi:hypothetical protein BCPG3_037 [Bacillus phage BCPG3]|uniref:Uncharacterized protein n=3 Tax=Wphvirus TaxID=1922327 RepID=W5QUM6_9CAUD|nr:hypothetical protein [Bacillus thuringiensis]YP_006907576.1 hypothetical protein BPS13_0017 [Bacillus phage BPS13]YP_009002903.1 hypothetical protein BPS10C_017 [Bacillus phage BPS10C]YP_009282014.1 hypothetical protein SALINJAH_60 [Bacillus phage SalinJah]QQO38967.1 hypothetical protein BCPG1_236 [Bacillus phage BCPG1]QSJ04354.1 hypothetical protein BCPG3_037 [Bacillus phage BCPG3]QSJ04566.1 hypothetical protein BCP18_034 [Bacillus phage BCP18]AEZ50196.1 hypothetical protein BPS13_0017 [